jgi:SAM-dependent methyltransferase
MKQLNDVQIKKSPWFKQWFDSQYYHSLYKNRNDQEAAGFVETLMDTLQPAVNSKMIDVGCGAGRHCRQLASGPYDVWGIDLSGSSILQAKKYESSSLHFFRHDMRKSYGKNYFDYVFNFFTSFGYFDDQQEHDLVVKHMADALKPAGKLVMDYMNTDYSAMNLRPFEKKEVDGIEYDIERWSDDHHFFKRIKIKDQFPGASEHVEKVAKFRLEDLPMIREVRTITGFCQRIVQNLSMIIC